MSASLGRDRTSSSCCSLAMVIVCNRSCGGNSRRARGIRPAVSTPFGDEPSITPEHAPSLFGLGHHHLDGVGRGAEDGAHLRHVLDAAEHVDGVAVAHHDHEDVTRRDRRGVQRERRADARDHPLRAVVLVQALHRPGERRAGQPAQLRRLPHGRVPRLAGPRAAAQAPLQLPRLHGGALLRPGRPRARRARGEPQLAQRRTTSRRSSERSGPRRSTSPTAAGGRTATSPTTRPAGTRSAT